MASFDNFIFVALPYLAVVVCLVGSIYRVKFMPTTYSSLSSQFLESRGLMWGSLPWHIGIIAIVLGHFLAFLFPGFWQLLVAHKPLLLVIETLGLGFSLLCLAGILVLFVRRTTSSRVQSVTSNMDLVVLVLLLVQVGLGIYTAVSHSWGSAWSLGTTCPYLLSLCAFSPQIDLVQDLPHAVKAHMVLAWILIGLIPFSRLIHMFAVPIEYLTRPWQNVVWLSGRRTESNPQVFQANAARRHFILGGLASLFGISLLSVGVFDKIFRFFFGPRLSAKEESDLMSVRLARLESTTSQRKLELERQENEYILIGSLAELSIDKGKYFIDYQMMPALAFLGKNDLPLLISAKCTHLGCTVSSEAKDGKVLCPCHISYFDIETGAPNADSPAKAPLPHLPWVVMDTRGRELASFDGKSLRGSIDSNKRLSARVYIPKENKV